jgi:hypothetical protein
MYALWFVLFITSLSVAQVDVLTQHNDNLRSGLNIHESILTVQTVSKDFGKLWTLYSDAKVMAQPLYVSNLKSQKCPGGCNTVIFASMKGTVYAYMADQKPNTQNDTLVWARYLGDPQNGSDDWDMWATDDPWWGILGTPVIDRTSSSMYAVVWNNDGQYRLYQLDLSSGNIKKGPVVIQGEVGGIKFVDNKPGWRQLRKQRAALLLNQGYLYVAFGGDNPDALAGWLFVYDAATLAFKTVWSPTPGGRNGGIWQSGQGPAADSDGNVYLQTGDGDADSSLQRYGDSLVKLTLTTGGLTVSDFFTPCNQLILRSCDADYGSAGPLLFQDFIVGGGKSGELYLMKRNKLAHYQPGPWPAPATSCGPGSIPACVDGPNMVQKWPATRGHIHGSPVFWQGPGGKGWLYVMGEGDHLKAFPFVSGKFDLAGVRQSSWALPKPAKPECGGEIMNWMPGGIISVSSNADTPRTGIVWVVVPANGDANSYRGVKGMLLALDAEDVSKELWRSQASNPATDTPDSFGLLARFAPITVAGGKVFVGNAGDKEPLKRWCRPNRPKTFPQNYGIVVYGRKNLRQP